MGENFVTKKIDKEIQMGKTAGLFKERLIFTLRITWLGLVSKKTPEEYGLIHHLSYPEGSGTSVNDYIPPTQCSINY